MPKQTTVHRQECEIYSRVVGYLRPTQSWNAGKQAEFHDRSVYQAKTTTNHK